MPDDEDDDRTATCDNCGGQFDLDLIVPLESCRDLGERLDPGSVVPAGECPECGAFCYLDPDPNQPAAS